MSVCFVAFFVVAVGTVGATEETGVEAPLWYGENADSSAATPEFIRAEPDLTPVVPINDHGKRRQYIPAPVVPLAAGPPLPAAGVCPGRPLRCRWSAIRSARGRSARPNPTATPRTPSTSGPTFAALWRPATPFYNYVPPPPPNWPPVLRAAVGQWPSAAVGLPPFHKSRRPARLGVDNSGPPPEQLRHMIGVMNDWIQRENDHEKETTELAASGAEPTAEEQKTA
ncbi:hypothetical protein M3Y99_00839600 [Aphelenchoides fujianensis]|nr:hypothetical protein M3Y99_00839600 [Aphelenchoides fujianensis]